MLRAGVGIQIPNAVRIIVLENSSAGRTLWNHVVQEWQIGFIILQLIGSGCLECSAGNSEVWSVFNRKEGCDRLVMSAVFVGLTSVTLLCKTLCRLSQHLYPCCMVSLECSPCPYHHFSSWLILQDLPLMPLSWGDLPCLK